MSLRCQLLTKHVDQVCGEQRATKPQYGARKPDPSCIVLLSGMYSRQKTLSLHSNNGEIQRNVLGHKHTLAGEVRRYRSRKTSLSLKSMMREFAEETTFHGIQYVISDRSSLFDRLIWLVVFLLSLGCSLVLCWSMVLKYMGGPTVTLVKDTHYPLHLFPFPAITVCPTDKIKRDVALSYIYERLNSSKGQISEDKLDQFLSAMAVFQHPTYSHMMRFLNPIQDILRKLVLLNLTDLMIQVLPKCHEVFSICSWHGMTENCCDLFHIQRSEEGFCYSFNSVTSQRLSQCPQVTYDDHVDFDEIMRETRSQCVLRRNSAAGTSTGLQVFLAHFDPSEYITNHSAITGESGVRVQLHTCDQYPEAGMGLLVPARSGVKLVTTIKAYLTESQDTVRTLPIAERNCYFPDETALGIAAQYSQTSCLIECRLRYFNQVCGCRPYYFNMMDNKIPTCNSMQLSCIAKHGVNVKFYRPPLSSHKRGFAPTETVKALNCTECLPTCHESYYDDDSDLTTDPQPRALENYGFLDMYYKSGGAVYYQRDVTYGWVDLLVGIGGTAGLFLGISLLSVVELVYWSAKLVSFALCKKEAKKNPSTLPKGLVYDRDFLY